MVLQWYSVFSSSSLTSTSTSNSTSKCAEEGYNVMLLHFLAHVHIEQQHGELALECYKIVQPIFPHSHYLQTQMALAHYTLLEYEQALTGFEQIRQEDPHRMDHMDTYSNILYVKELRADLSTLARLVVKVNKLCPQSCCVVGNYYSLRGSHEKAVYFRRALKLNPEFFIRLVLDLITI